MGGFECGCELGYAKDDSGTCVESSKYQLDSRPQLKIKDKLPVPEIF